MKCQSCGANIYDDVNRCQYCGAYQPIKNPPPQAAAQPQQQPVIYNIINNVSPQRVSTQRPAASSKEKWVAFFLFLFLGCFGAHKFYVGKAGAGVLYLFTMGLFGVGWFIDLICIICGASTDKWGRKLV